MKKNNIYLIALIGLIFFYSCEKDKELTDSIYLSDAEYPELPVYSEWGYNTFGAYFDREIFRSNNSLIPLKIICQNDSISFLFKGQKEVVGASSYSYNNYFEEMLVEICLSNSNIKHMNDLLLLNDSTITLDASTCKAKFIINNVPSSPEVLGGQLEIKNSRVLIVDEEPFGIILSGKFYLQVRMHGEPISLSEGRFDISMTIGNFYSF